MRYDVLMAPGLPDLASVKAVCAAIAKPFNFMAGIPISLAGSLYRAAMGGLVAAAHGLKDKGTFSYRACRSPLPSWRRLACVAVDTALPSAELAGFMRG
jgi:hypothetical protein